MGLSASAELMEAGEEALAKIELEEAFDEIDDLLRSFGGEVGSIAKVLMTGIQATTQVGLSIGALGIRQIAEFIEHAGDGLVQGALAGAILYYHGMELAGYCLSLDIRHRNEPAMQRNFLETLGRGSTTAGKILLEQVKIKRRALRDKRLRAFTRIPGGKKILSRFKSDDEADHQPEEEAVSETTADLLQRH